MLNIERYKEKIINILYQYDGDFGLKNGEIVECHTISCEECGFHKGNCKVNTIKWLAQEYVYSGNKATWYLDEDSNSITCSNCGCEMWANDLIGGDAHYCPNCGAKM